ncbi:hypothetical protein ZEAMMB73_Zm00001d013562 [Zea mays]|uniref:Uncharacterized protein n=1 Tax=Zea mays TaxID=4577 RepID=A0A1D6GKL2_MAIZE|nr:hypothetical protein ZEAMMB73_Zm00001d013562 [Zea mays]
MEDVLSLLPHVKKDNQDKVESKQSKGNMPNKLLELRSCSNYLSSRLYEHNSTVKTEFLGLCRTSPLVSLHVYFKQLRSVTPIDIFPRQETRAREPGHAEGERKERRKKKWVSSSMSSARSSSSRSRATFAMAYDALSES